MHDGWNDVIARLAVVDMVVGVHGAAAEVLAEQLAGPVGYHLVGIHVGAGSGTGLENIQREMLIQVADNHFLGSIHDRQGDALVEQAKLAIDLGSMLLDHAERTQEGAREADPGNCEVVTGPCSLGAVKSVNRHGHGAHGILFGAGCGHKETSFSTLQAVNRHQRLYFDIFLKSLAVLLRSAYQQEGRCQSLSSMFRLLK